MSTESCLLSDTSVHESHAAASQGCRTVRNSCHRRTATATARWASCIAMQPRSMATRRRCLVSGWLIIPRIWRLRRTAVPPGELLRILIRRSSPPAAPPAWAPISPTLAASPSAAPPVSPSAAPPAISRPSKYPACAKRFRKVRISRSCRGNSKGVHYSLYKPYIKIFHRILYIITFLYILIICLKNFIQSLIFSQNCPNYLLNYFLARYIKKKTLYSC